MSFIHCNDSWEILALGSVKGRIEPLRYLDPISGV